jgi:hypothetical protein
VSRSDKTLVLFWTASAAGFDLESVDALGGTWTPVDVTPAEVAGQKIVTFPMSGASRYFRLRKP